MAAAKAPIIKVPDFHERILSITKHVESQVEGASLQTMHGEIPKIPVLSSGSLTLDRCLGVGGYPLGRIVEVFGPYSAGKTTLTLHAIASAMKSGGIAAFIDAEHALDMTYAKALGVDPEKLILCQPDFGEQGLAVVDHLLDTGMFKKGDIIVVDSVAALTPKTIIEGEIDKQTMAVAARMMSTAMGKLKGKVSQSGVLLYFTNQIRETLSQYGPATDTPGGGALKFYSSIRVEIKKVSTVMVGVPGTSEQKAIANITKVKVVKNKVAPPFMEAELTIRYGEGVSRFDEIIDVGSKFNVIQKNGSFYKFAGQTLGQGKETAMRNLKNDPTLADELFNLISHRSVTGECDDIPPRAKIWTKDVVIDTTAELPS